MSDVQAYQAYTHILEAEVERMRVELAEYKHTHGVEVVEYDVGDGRGWYVWVPSWSRDEINRYLPIEGPTLQTVSPMETMPSIEKQNMRLLCSWIGLDVDNGCYLTINHNEYHNFCMVASKYKHGAFVVRDGSYREYWMTTTNAERVVRDIAAHFTIRVQ